jgi:hypothetical protein
MPVATHGHFPSSPINKKHHLSSPSSSTVYFQTSRRQGHQQQAELVARLKAISETTFKLPSPPLPQTNPYSLSPSANSIRPALDPPRAPPQQPGASSIGIARRPPRPDLGAALRGQIPPPPAASVPPGARFRAAPPNAKLAPQKRSQRGGGSGGGASAAAAASSAAAGDSGDAVMARWLQSAGLQHLAASSGAGGGVVAVDLRGGGLGGGGAGGLLPSLLMQVRLIHRLFVHWLWRDPLCACKPCSLCACCDLHFEIISLSMGIFCMGRFWIMWRRAFLARSVVFFFAYGSLLKWHESSDFFHPCPKYSSVRDLKLSAAFFFLGSHVALEQNYISIASHTTLRGTICRHVYQFGVWLASWGLSL